MRRIVAALVVALIALTLAGCGGTAETPTQEPTTPTQPKPAVPQTEPLVDRSPVEMGAPEPFPSMETTPPPDIVQQKLDAKRPMVLFFYDSAQEITGPQREEVDAVIGEYRGLIDLVTFDVTSGKAAEPGDAAQVAATFAGQLGIKSTPYLVIVNDERTITWRWLGFIDRELIGREVLSATE